MARESDGSRGHVSSSGHEMSSSEWLDAHFLAMQPEYEEMLRWVGLQPSWHVLDAGCGSGSFLPLMTELVGSSGRISALDIDPENIRIVEKRAAESGWAAPVAARTGSVVELPYDDNTFDVVWSANTTQYLSDEELQSMLAECRRVTRPGGLVAIKDYDVTALQIQPTTPTLFIHGAETACQNGSQYNCGLLRVIELASWLREAGLVDLRQKPTLMVRFQPIDNYLKQLLTEFFQYSYQVAQQLELPEEEMRLWEKLVDLDAEDHIFNHPDFQYRAIQTLFVGHVPG